MRWFKDSVQQKGYYQYREINKSQFKIKNEHCNNGHRCNDERNDWKCRIKRSPKGSWQIRFTLSQDNYRNHGNDIQCKCTKNGDNDNF